MTSKVDITVDLTRYSKAELASGEITVELDLDEEGLVCEDEVEEYIDVDDFLRNLDDEDLEKELERREKDYALDYEMDVVSYSRNVIEHSPRKAREFMCDILGLQHTAMLKTILDELEHRIR